MRHTPRLPIGVPATGGTSSFPAMVVLLSFIVGPVGAKSTSNKCIYTQQDPDSSASVQARSEVGGWRHLAINSLHHPLIIYHYIRIEHPLALSFFRSFVYTYINPHLHLSCRTLYTTHKLVLLGFKRPWEAVNIRSRYNAIPSIGQNMPKDKQVWLTNRSLQAKKAFWHPARSHASSV